MFPELTNDDLVVTWSTRKIRGKDLIVFVSENNQKLVKMVSKIEGSQISVVGTNTLLGSTLTSKPISSEAIIGKVVFTWKGQLVRGKFLKSLSFQSFRW